MAVSHSPVCYFLSDCLWASEIPFVLVGLCLLKKIPAGLQKGVWMEDRVCKLHRLLLVASHPRVAQLGGRRAVPDLVKPRSTEPLPPSSTHCFLLGFHGGTFFRFPAPPSRSPFLPLLLHGFPVSGCSRGVPPICSVTRSPFPACLLRPTRSSGPGNDGESCREAVVIIWARSDVRC